MDPSEASSVTGISRERRGVAKRLRMFAGGSYLLGSLLLAPSLGANPQSFGIAVGTALSLLALLLVFVSWFFARSFRESTGTVRADSKGLTFITQKTTTTIDREQITSPLILLPDAFNKIPVELHLQNGDVAHFNANTLEQAQELLNAAHLGGKEHRAFEHFDNWVRWFIRAFCMLELAMAPLLYASSVSNGTMSLGVALGAGLAIYGIFGGLLAAMRPTSLTVGTDGLLVNRWGQKRFIDFDQVHSVEVAPGSLQLRRHDGSVEYLPLPGDQVRITAFAERVKQSLANHGKGTEESLAWKGALAQAGRSLETWSKELLDWARSEGSYRQAVPPLDALVRVVLDSSANDEERVAAAVALRASDPKNAATHLRVASESSANETLRAAFDELSNEAGDEVVARVLKRVSA